MSSSSSSVFPAYARERTLFPLRDMARVILGHNPVVIALLYCSGTTLTLSFRALREAAEHEEITVLSTPLLELLPLVFTVEQGAVLDIPHLVQMYLDLSSDVPVIPWREVTVDSYNTLPPVFAVQF